MVQAKPSFVKVRQVKVTEDFPEEEVTVDDRLIDCVVNIAKGKTIKNYDESKYVTVSKMRCSGLLKPKPMID